MVIHPKKKNKKNKNKSKILLKFTYFPNIPPACKFFVLYILVILTITKQLHSLPIKLSSMWLH